MVDLETGNWKIKSGDFAVGDSRLQEALSLINGNMGDFRHYPLAGCNLIKYMQSNRPKSELEREQRKQLEADGLDYNAFKIAINLG